MKHNKSPRKLIFKSHTISNLTIDEIRLIKGKDDDRATKCPKCDDGEGCDSEFIGCMTGVSNPPPCLV